MQQTSERPESRLSLLREFFVAVCAARGLDYAAKISDMTLSVFESALSDIPEDELHAALNATIRNVEFWPTPAHVRTQWEQHHAKDDQAAAEKSWDGVLEHIRKWGVEQHSVFMGGKEHKPPTFDGVTEFAMRQAGGYRTIGNAPGDQLRFMRKTFCDAYQRHRETAGYLAPTRAEAKRLLSQMPNGLTEKVLDRVF